MKTYNNFINESIINPELSRFFGKLFQSRDVAHLNHLSTASFAEHKALNDYYDDIIGLVDGLIENYQGIYGKTNIIIEGCQSNLVDSVSYFKDLESYIKNNKETLFSDSELLNQVDEIDTLIGQTLYKLKELTEDKKIKKIKRL